MAKIFAEITDNLQAYEIKGLGCLVRAKPGAQLLFLEGATINEEMEIVMDQDRYAIANAAEAPKPVKQGPSPIASVNVKSFLTEMDRKNLTAGGEFGPLGPILGKLNHVLKGSDEGSAVRTAFGDLLGMGDHGRYGSAAAVLAMNAQQLDRLNEVLNSPEGDIVQEFVDSVIPAIA